MTRTSFSSHLLTQASDIFALGGHGCRCYHVLAEVFTQ